MQQRMQKRPQLLRHSLGVLRRSHTRRRILGHTLRINLPRIQCALRLYRLGCYLSVPLQLLLLIIRIITRHAS